MTYSITKTNSLHRLSAKYMITAAAASLMLLAAAPAEAGDYGNRNGWNPGSYGRGYDRTNVSFNYGYSGPAYHPPHYAPRPVYYAPRPVYYTPPPVYYAPRPVYYAPRPVYYPRPAYYPSYSSISFSYSR